MKNILSLLLSILLVFTLVACTTEVPGPIQLVEVPGPTVYVDRVLTETVEVEKIVYEEIKYIEVEVVEYIAREMTEEELEDINDDIREELQEVFDVDLQKAKDELEPITIEVDKIVREPISNEEYEHYYTYCTIERPNKVDLVLTNLTIQYGITSAVTGNYTVILDEVDDDGVKTRELNEEDNPYDCGSKSEDIPFTKKN